MPLYRTIPTQLNLFVPIGKPRIGFFPYTPEYVTLSGTVYELGESTIINYEDLSYPEKFQQGFYEIPGTGSILVFHDGEQFHMGYPYTGEMTWWV